MNIIRQIICLTTEKNEDTMYQELLNYEKQIGNTYLKQVVEYYFVNNQEFVKVFKGHSAAKSVHHGFARRTFGTYIKCCEDV